MPFKLDLNPEKVMVNHEKIKSEEDIFRQKAADKFSGHDLADIYEALDFMLKIHLPQKDRVDGSPFAGHPLAVAERVMNFSDNSQLVVAALLHDSVEDQPDHIFISRIDRKYPDRKSIHLDIDETLRVRHKEEFSNWSLREIKERFGDKTKYYIERMTNPDFNSLAAKSKSDDLDRQSLINRLYLEHVEELVHDPELFILKLSDVLVNININHLSPDSEKHKKLRRKYPPVIKMILEKLKNIPEGHPLYKSKNEIIAELSRIYQEQYSSIKIPEKN